MTDSQCNTVTVPTGTVPIPIGLINPTATNNMTVVGYSNTTGTPPAPQSVPHNTILYLVTGPVAVTPGSAYTVTITPPSVSGSQSASIVVQAVPVEGCFQAIEFNPTFAGTWTITVGYGATYAGVIQITAT